MSTTLSHTGVCTVTTHESATSGQTTTTHSHNNNALVHMLSLTTQNTHQASNLNPLFNLPIELLILILDNLDQTSLESLRRTSRVFLRLLPSTYPTLFTYTLQGPSPYPVRRLWTIGTKEREELVRLLRRDELLVRRSGPGPESGLDGVRMHGRGQSAEGAGMVQTEGSTGSVRGVCCGRMMGLRNAWRYIPCADCGKTHPPRAVTLAAKG